MPEDIVPEMLANAVKALEREFAALPPYDPARPNDSNSEAMVAVLEETAHLLGDNYPYFHPLYAGQMLKPPHPVARAAYALAMTVNPNNHARDGGRASSAMEIEAVAEIALMFGWSEFLGHLTSGGTMANLEALWVAGQVWAGKADSRVGTSALHPPPHLRSLETGVRSLASDTRGRMRLDALEDELRKGNVGTVVVTLGTTGIGAVDPLPEILRSPKPIRLPGTCGCGLRRLLQAHRRSSGRAGKARLCGNLPGRLDCDRPPQTWAAAVWVRVRAVSGPRRGPVLQA